MTLRLFRRKLTSAPSPLNAEKDAVKALPQIIRLLEEAKALCEANADKAIHLGLHTTLDSVSALCDAGTTSLQKCFDSHKIGSDAVKQEEKDVWSRLGSSEDECWRPDGPSEKQARLAD